MTDSVIDDGNPRARAAVLEAITSRRSIRAFLGRPVARSDVECMLETAAHAPSGSNLQPWKVHVLCGTARDSLAAALSALHAQGVPPTPEYAYYPKTWRSPYLERRRATGWQLYDLLGIKRGDFAAAERYRGRNYDFFGAPVGLIVTMDRDMETGSWIDLGLFLQSLMVAARALGLHTCPQAAFANYGDAVRITLALPESELIVCGMAIGYPDWDHPVNRLRTTREPLTKFASFRWDETTLVR